MFFVFDYAYHLELLVLTHSFPPRRSSDLIALSHRFLERRAAVAGAVVATLVDLRQNRFERAADRGLGAHHLDLGPCGALAGIDQFVDVLLSKIAQNLGRRPEFGRADDIDIAGIFLVDHRPRHVGEAVERRNQLQRFLEDHHVRVEPRSEAHTSELQSLMRISYAYL